MQPDTRHALVQAALERLMDNERLRGDLQDPAAAALLAWADAQLRAVGDDLTLASEDALMAALNAVQQAAWAAARSGATAAHEVVVRAQAALEQAHAAPPSAAVAYQQSALEQAFIQPVSTRSQRRHLLFRRPRSRPRFGHSRGPHTPRKDP